MFFLYPTTYLTNKITTEKEVQKRHLRHKKRQLHLYTKDLR